LTLKHVQPPGCNYGCESKNPHAAPELTNNEELVEVNAGTVAAAIAELQSDIPESRSDCSMTPVPCADS
jgi:hypothetical protein